LDLAGGEKVENSWEKMGRVAADGELNGYREDERKRKVATSASDECQRIAATNAPAGGLFSVNHPFHMRANVGMEQTRAFTHKPHPRPRVPQISTISSFRIGPRSTTELRSGTGTGTVESAWRSGESATAKRRLP
jgi:hypothetical protein